MTTSLESPRLYIDGTWVESSGDGAVDVINPATEAVIASVPDMHASTIFTAVMRI